MVADASNADGDDVVTTSTSAAAVDPVPAGIDPAGVDDGIDHVGADDGIDPAGADDGIDPVGAGDGVDHVGAGDGIGVSNPIASIAAPRDPGAANPIGSSGLLVGTSAADISPALAGAAIPVFAGIGGAAANWNGSPGFQPAGRGGSVTESPDFHSGALSVDVSGFSVSAFGTSVAGASAADATRYEQARNTVWAIAERRIVLLRGLRCTGAQVTPPMQCNTVQAGP